MEQEIAKNLQKPIEQRPFMGLRSYEESNKEQFGGRDKEISELYTLVESNRLTIVFGKSGIGKTSLIKAGLIPELQKNFFFPIYIRIDFMLPKRPLEQVKELIFEKLKARDPKTPEFGKSTLWEYFRNLHLLDGVLTPVLILDQFEEIFTIGKERAESVHDFVIELSDLAENRVPIAVKEEWMKSDEVISSSSSTPNFHLIISLREDYLANLESLKTYLPSIKNSRFRVLQMTAHQAMDSVLKSAKNLIDRDVAVLIIKKLPGIKDLDFEVESSGESNQERYVIEPFLLSLICYEINEKRIGEDLDVFNRQLVEQFDISDVINSYYNKTMKSFREDVQKGVENSLLTETGYRKLQELGEMENEYKIRADEILQLVEKRIIRKETRDGVEYIELIHDTLVGAVRKAKRDRLEAEKLEAEKEKAKQMFVAEQKKRRRRLMQGISFSFLLILGLIFVGYLFLENKVKNRLRDDIEPIDSLINAAVSSMDRASYNEDKDPTLALQLDTAALLSLDSVRKLLNTLSGKTYTFNESYRKNVYDRLYSKYLEKDSLIKAHVNAILDKDYAFYKIVKPENLKDTIFDVRFINGIFPDSNTFKVWHGEKTIINSIQRNGQLYKVVFPTDSNRAMALYNDGTAGYFDSTGKYRQIQNNDFSTSIAPVFYTIFRFKTLLATENRTIEAWNLYGSPRVDRTVEKKVIYKNISPEIKNHITSIAISEKRNKIFAVDGNGMGAIWIADMNNIILNPSSVFNIYQDTILCSAFSNDGFLIATGSKDNSVKIWSADSGILIKVLKGHTGPITSVAFSANGRFIYTGSLDRTFRQWRIPSRAPKINWQSTQWNETRSWDSLFIMKIIDLKPDESSNQ